MAKKSSPRKLGQAKLSDAERAIIAQAKDTDFYKLVTEKILTSRATQIGLTTVSAAATSEELWYYKGMMYQNSWLRDYLLDESGKVDLDTFDNDDDELTAEDDDPRS